MNSCWNRNRTGKDHNLNRALMNTPHGAHVLNYTCLLISNTLNKLKIPTRSASRGKITWAQLDGILGLDGMVF